MLNSFKRMTTWSSNVQQARRVRSISIKWLQLSSLRSILYNQSGSIYFSISIFLDEVKLKCNN